MQVDNSFNKALETIFHGTDPQTSSAPAAQDAPPVMPELNELQCSGDPGAMLAALTMQSAKNQEQASRNMRDEAMSAQEKADAAAVQDMRDKATLQRAEGFVEGACDIAKGACDLGSGLNGIAADKAKANGDTKAEHRDETNAAWDKFGASLADATKSIAHGLFEGAITDKGADEKVHEASADAFKQIADDAHDDEKDAKDLLNKALDFYKEYVDTKNQTVMAAIHRA